MYCSHCGKEVNEKAVVCVNCGCSLKNTNYSLGNYEGKNKLVAGLLAIFLGGLGLHKFYMGKPILGIIYLLFCWTFVPSIIGFVEGLIYLTESDAAFEERLKA